MLTETDVLGPPVLLRMNSLPTLKLERVLMPMVLSPVPAVEFTTKSLLMFTVELFIVAEIMAVPPFLFMVKLSSTSRVLFERTRVVLRLLPGFVTVNLPVMSNEVLLTVRDVFAVAVVMFSSPTFAGAVTIILCPSI